jgi:antitoxin VapB
MAINIRNPEVEDAIRKLAKLLNVDLTEAVGCAVRGELSRTENSVAIRLTRMRAIADRVASLPVLDTRTDNEIMGYDDAGLPG